MVYITYVHDKSTYMFCPQKRLLSTNYCLQGKPTKKEVWEKGYKIPHVSNDGSVFNHLPGLKYDGKSQACPLRS